MEPNLASDVAQKATKSQGLEESAPQIYTSARNPISDRLLPWRPVTSLFLSLIRDPALSIGPIRLFAYEAGPIKLLVSGDFV